MFYVIDGKRNYVTHESRDVKSCERFIANVRDLYGRSSSEFTIAAGAKQRDEILKRK